MFRLSILIPFIDDATRFEDTLASVLQHRPENCEILVVHRGRYDDPYELSGEVCFIETEAKITRIQAINIGCRAAKGYVVNLLQPGVLVGEDWHRSALGWFDDREIGAVAPLLRCAGTPEQVLSAGLRYSRGGRRSVHGHRAPIAMTSRLLEQPVVGPTLSMGFYRRTLLEAVGGFCEAAGPRYADLDMALTLKSLGFRCALEPECSALAEAELERVRPSFSSGRGAERVFWMHASESGWASSVFSHGFTVAGEFAREIARPGAYTSLLGRLIAFLERGSVDQQRDRLRCARECIDRRRSLQKRQRPSAGQTGAETAGDRLLGGLQTRRAA